MRKGKFNDSIGKLQISKMTGKYEEIRSDNRDFEMLRVEGTAVVIPHTSTDAMIDSIASHLQ